MVLDETQPFHELTPSRELDKRIAVEVLSLIWNGFAWSPHDYETGMTLDVNRYHDLPLFSRNMDQSWQVVETMAKRMGYDHLGYVWRGPLFKPEHYYMTEDGYGLGTTCWYVHVETGDLIQDFCADTPALAVCQAALFVVSMGIK